WRHPENEQQWTNSLTSYCKENKHPIWDKDVALVEKGDVTAILRPIWDKKPVTARRVRHRIEKVLDFAKANGWRKGDNPAKWVGDLKELLPPLPGGGHQPACPVDQVPAFLAELRGRKSDGVRGTAEAALEFAILTNTRSTAAWK